MNTETTYHATQVAAQAYAKAYKDSWGWYGIQAVVGYHEHLDLWTVVTQGGGDSDDN